MNQAITSQALSFCPVIPAADEPEGQIRMQKAMYGFRLRQIMLQMSV